MTFSSTVRAVVTGRVQGVGFRESLARVARDLCLRGWVRNRDDGSVEFVAAGPADALDALTSWARRGPPAARVDGLVCTPSEEGFSIDRFEVRR